MKDRFKNYDSDVRELVLGFEEMLRKKGHRFFDVDELTIISDFYLETNDLASLEQAVRYAEHLYPDHNEVRLRRSHLLCTKERFQEAYEILLDLERHDPENTDVLYALGTVHSAMGNHRKAIQYYLKTSQDGYELGTVFANVGDEYADLGMDREAMCYYQRSLEKTPKEERAIHGLCECYENLQKQEQGVAFFSQFVDNNPYSATAWYCLGLLYYDLKLFEKSIDAFEFATTIDPHLQEAYTFKAYAFHDLGDLPHAIASLREALPQVEDKAHVNSLIAFYYMEVQNFDTALIYLKSAVECDPSDGPCWMAMASCYAQQNEYYPAMDCMERAFRECPNEPALLIDAARIHAVFGEDELAEKRFEEGLSTAAYDDRCWTDYADFLLERQLWDKAIDVLQRGLAQCDEPLYFHLRLAEAFFRTGRRNHLFNSLQACVQIDRTAALELLEVCPGMGLDLEVMNILTSE